MTVLGRAVRTLLWVLALSASAARGQSPITALHCEMLGVEVPRSVPSTDHPSVLLLNQDTLNAIARSVYRPRWHRFATLRVQVRRDGTVSYGCRLQASGDTVFDRIALETLGRARFQVVADPPPEATWTDLWVVATAAVDWEENERYTEIALREPLEARFRTKTILAMQAAVLDYLVEHNDSHARERPNQAICIGVGSILPVYDAPESLTGALAPTPLPKYAASSCVLDRQRRRLILRSDDVPAIALWVDINDVEGETAEVDAGYYEGVLSSASYRCQVRHVNDRWTVDTCRVTAIS